VADDIKIDVKIKDRGVKELLEKLQRRHGNLGPVMKTIGEIVVTSINRNFEEGGRPKWKRLAKATIRAKKHAKPLIKEGLLMGSIKRKAYKDRVVIGPDAFPHAAIHQFGGKAGRGRKTIIPARPYLKVHNEDWAEIKEVLNDYLTAG
jgi:phage virion morphogenesis protein